MTDPNVDRRLAALESRLGRLEQMLGTLNDRLAAAPAPGETKLAIQAWVTDYVSMRLQQLVPETCEHPEGEAPAAVAEGPLLPGTRVRCTEEVLHRLGRIPIPFVRQMVTQKVAESARVESVTLVDVTFFERAATFWQCKLAGEDLLSYQHWQQHVMAGPALWTDTALGSDDPVDVPIEDSLDLHSFLPRDVRSVVNEYLEVAHARGFREVRLIHGRGIGVQRAIVQSLLSGHPRVADFADAPEDRGGKGATVVRLRWRPSLRR